MCVCVCVNSSQTAWQFRPTYDSVVSLCNYNSLFEIIILTVSCSYDLLDLSLFVINSFICYPCITIFFNFLNKFVKIWLFLIFFITYLISPSTSLGWTCQYLSFNKAWFQTILPKSLKATISRFVSLSFTI